METKKRRQFKFNAQWDAGNTVERKNDKFRVHSYVDWHISFRSPVEKVFFKQSGP